MTGLTTTIHMPLDSNKEVFTAECDGGYVGCLRLDNVIAITSERYEKPLQAANAARKLKKQVGQVDSKSCIDPENSVKKESVQALNKSPETKKSLILSLELYTHEEMQSMPQFNFHEVWLITKEGEFVSDCMNQKAKRLVAFTSDRAKAKRFEDHEAAKRTMTTLKGVVGPGFGLMRVYGKVK